MTSSHLQSILHDVAKERKRQLGKWGVQDHERPFWMVILGEEYGEVCRAVFEGENSNYREELIQVAAVAVAAVEAYDRERLK